MSPRTHPAGRRTLGCAATAAAALALASCGGAVSSPSEDTRTAGAPSVTTSASATPSATPTPFDRPTPSARPAASSRAPTPSPSQRIGTGPVKANEVAKGLETPWGLVSLRDSSILVSERDTGRILHVREGKATEVTKLGQVEPQGEGGLLGLVITPDQKTVYAYFTAEDDNRIVAMSWDGSSLGKPETILDGIPKGWRHNGGRLVIGPDGLLYVGTGEIGEERLAQDKKSLGGKILRITLDGKPAPGNPFDNEVFSYGHRNVQGLAFDGSGRLWASEFGNQTWDELNLVTKGGNYGWPETEGSADSSGSDEFVNPKVVWRTDDASPSGLAYWQGELWMAALQGERLWEIPVSGTKVGEPKSHFADDYGRLRSVTVTSDGRSMLLSASNTDGRGQPSKVDDQLLRITR